MSITDELREYATVGWEPWAAAKEQLYRMCDRIDSEHEKAMSRAGQLLADAEKDRDYNYANWQECKQKVLQGNITFNEFEVEIERLKDELLHSIELPKDADSEYIHEHDKVDWRDHAGTWHENATVVAVCNDGCYVIDGTVFHHVHKSDIRHHHAPTVEDVLAEFGIDWEHESDCEDRAALLKEYAAKLRLAEGED